MTSFRISRTVHLSAPTRVLALVLLAVALLALGCGSSSTTTTTAPAGTTTAPATAGSGTTGATTATTGSPGAGNAVTIAGFAFSPASLTVKVGDAVTWTNNDSTTHTVTADDGSFSSGDVAPGATFSFTFKKAGSFGYHCSIHPSMTATVVVQ
jgi:plastocyanin